MIIKGCEIMTATHYLGLLGGLALFLLGMNMLSQGLTSGLGERLEIILLKLTNHRMKAIGVGILLTALIQSSSAMSVILIGFLNAHIMTLKRAIWIMMGANIGTTITGQMIALDIGAFAPALSFIGVLFYLISQGIKQLIGQVMMALGLFVYGIRNDVTIHAAITTFLMDYWSFYATSKSFIMCWYGYVIYGTHSKFISIRRHFTNFSDATACFISTVSLSFVRF